MDLDLVDVVELRLLPVSVLLRLLEVLILDADAPVLVELALEMDVVLGLDPQVVAGAKRVHDPRVAHLVCDLLLESTAQVNHIDACL